MSLKDKIKITSDLFEKFHNLKDEIIELNDIINDKNIVLHLCKVRLKEGGIGGDFIPLLISGDSEDFIKKSLVDLKNKKIDDLSRLEKQLEDMLK